MSSTSDVFLAVSAQAPEPSGKRHSMLTPVIEADDEAVTDRNPADKAEISHPEFDISSEEKQIFLTESQQSEYVASKNGGMSISGDAPEDVVDGPVVSEKFNSDGEYFDEMYSDSSSEDSDTQSKDGDYETDLEFDEEKWLYPERFDIDLTGKAKYVKTCEDMGISPTTYFIKHIQDRELKMKFHGLGPQRMKALAVPLQMNTNIEILNLEGNAIDEDGAICLTKVLRENFFITELVLAENNLRTEGGKAIGEMLINNRNLYKVDLTNNDIGDGASATFCEVLNNNKLLKIMLLGNNSFEDEGARLFKSAISDNTTLEVLDLSWNNFKNRGAILLAEALQENIGLKSFNMAMDGLGRDGAEAIARALRENRTLLELDISLNRINMEGAIALARGVKENDTLTVLKCGSNPFDSEGAMEILEAVDMNDSSELKLLDFSNIMVKMNFAKLQCRLQDERGMKIINEGVIPEFARTNSARLTAFRVDPIGTFKNNAERADVDLGELLVPYLDEEYSLDIKEFKTIIKNTKIDLSSEQINIIALRLSLDGRVQCRTLFDINEDEGDRSSGNSRVESPANTDRSDKSERRGSRTNNKMIPPKFVKNHVVT
ncbi:leucine-rich repeat-containing protein 74A-like [Mercenaria mercenaria]|uniref:leucine-rich repeat-containing protein 74A-like n=1 Tax=Mercenaria mercenaria TaxID=6596 RepID=UPI001E1E17DC|nr:leucine-rich repeat-containing protein 74A-like [Mercenaria mercenaria]XP_045162898.1 leucine-rich repeat-containing protein 74A-like [Mercenaria mercenaria]XP_045162905.1 leucine-rich repeat-containing protein 74A-like [Mercenaria mercenaria]